MTGADKLITYSPILTIVPLTKWKTDTMWLPWWQSGES